MSETTTKKPATKTAQNKAAAGPLIYAGPTRPGLGLVHARVYKTIPPDVSALFEKLALLKPLFMPISRYPEASAQIRAESGVFYTAYEAVKNWKPETNGGETE